MSTKSQLELVPVQSFRDAGRILTDLLQILVEEVPLNPENALVDVSDTLSERTLPDFNRSTNGSGNDDIFSNATRFTEVAMGALYHIHQLGVDTLRDRIVLLELLASWAAQQKDLEKAEGFRQRALMMRESSLPSLFRRSDPPAGKITATQEYARNDTNLHLAHIYFILIAQSELASAMSNLAAVLQKRYGNRRANEAEALFRKAIRVRESALASYRGPSTRHPDVALLQLELASLLESQGVLISAPLL